MPERAAEVAETEVLAEVDVVLLGTGTEEYGAVEVLVANDNPCASSARSSRVVVEGARANGSAGR